MDVVCPRCKESVSPADWNSHMEKHGSDDLQQSPRTPLRSEPLHSSDDHDSPRLTASGSLDLNSVALFEQAAPGDSLSLFESGEGLAPSNPRPVDELGVVWADVIGANVWTQLNTRQRSALLDASRSEVQSAPLTPTSGPGSGTPQRVPGELGRVIVRRTLQRMLQYWNNNQDTHGILLLFQARRGELSGEVSALLQDLGL